MKKLSAKSVFDLVRGFQPACVIVAAAELDLFSILQVRPMKAAQVARRIKGDLRATTILLDALAALRLLQRNAGGDPVYRVPPAVAEVLTENGAHCMLGMVRHQGNCLRHWGQLAGVVRSGKPATRTPSAGSTKRPCVMRSRLPIWSAT